MTNPLDDDDPPQSLDIPTMDVLIPSKLSAPNSRTGSPNPHPGATNQPPQNTNDFPELLDSDDILSDKFSTLFNPPTPRASPSPSPSPKPPPLSTKSITPNPASTASPLKTSMSDDFGSFVDPLAASTLSLDSPEVNKDSKGFFDEFVSGARENVEGRRREVLGGAAGSGQGKGGGWTDVDLDFFTRSTPPARTTAEPLSMSMSMTPSSPSHSPTRTTTKRLSREHAPKLTRSPTLPTLAPPLASSSTASSPGIGAGGGGFDSYPYHDDDDPGQDEEERYIDVMSRSWDPAAFERRPRPRARRPSVEDYGGDGGGGNGRSKSYQTLSSISSRFISAVTSPPGSGSGDGGGGGSGEGKGGTGGSWMSTIKRGGTLDTLFSSYYPSSPAHTRSATTPSSSSPFGAGREQVDTLHPHPHSRHSPLPTPTGTGGRGASPFGAHVYLPPSGAPGFTGASYDWDKGFSGALEEEYAHVSASSATLPPRGAENGNGNGDGVRRNGDGAAGTNGGGQGGMAGFIEKKLGGVRLEGRREGTERVLEGWMADSLRPSLPPLSRLPRTWTLLYSLDQHGISLNTLYDRCERRVVGQGALLALLDASSHVFGVWVPEGIRRSSSSSSTSSESALKSYYGGGESFLFKFPRQVQAENEKEAPRIYKWTASNDYVALCEPDYVAFGGGDGTYGLYLDDRLETGSSCPCPTFRNEVLCADGPKKGKKGTVEFECVGLEVWGVGGT